MNTFNAGNFNIDNQPKKFSVPKIIFIVLGVAVVIEIIYAVFSLWPKGTPTPLSLVQNTQTTEASIPRMSLAVSQLSFTVDEVVPVSVTVDTGSNSISGVDLIIQYDPEILEVSNEDIAVGDVMDEYPLRSVDAEQGLVSISGISSLGNSFLGKGELATINFKAKSAGQTSLLINFEKDTTVASNLVEANSSRNILGEVDNLEILIE